MTEQQYAQLNKEYIEAKNKADKANEELKQIKEKLIEASNGERLELENLTVSYSSRTTVNYKQYLKDNNLIVPAKYISGSVSATIRVKKEQKEPEKHISV